MPLLKLCKVFVASEFLSIAASLHLFGDVEFKKRTISEVLRPDCKIFKFEFPFTNLDTDEIKFTNFKTTCNCTSANSDKEIYKPNESGKVFGTFEVGDRMGRQEKRINFEIVGKDKKKFTLFLNLTIPQLVEFRPKMLFWKVGSALESKKLRIDTAREYEARIIKAVCNSKNFKVDFTEQKKDTDSCELAVTPVNLDSEEKSEIILTCKARDNITKQFKIHILVR